MSGLAAIILQTIEEGLEYLWDGIKWAASKIGEFFTNLKSLLGKFLDYIRDEVWPKLVGRLTISELERVRETIKLANELKEKLEDLKDIVKRCSNGQDKAKLHEELQPLKVVAEYVETLSALGG